MRKLLFTTIAIIFFITCGTSQNNISKIQNKDFRTLYSLFPQMKSLYNYKISTDDLNAKDIPPKLAKEFFSLKERDFIYNDYEYNYEFIILNFRNSYAILRHKLYPAYKVCLFLYEYNFFYIFFE